MNEVKRKKEILYDINPYKLEEFIKSVLSDFFSCEVKHVGQTGDGGIDLIVINSDEPIMVQVKRRENPNHIELVNYIREFVGALYIKDSKKGIYVTTAKEFSKASKNVSNILLNSRKLDYFELVNFDKLISMVNINNMVTKPWVEFTKKYKFIRN